MYLFPIEASGMLHLSKCQTKANQRPLASCLGFTRPGFLQPHHHLGSSGSDLVGRQNKDVQDNIYCRHRRCRLSQNSTASSCVEHYFTSQSNSVTVLSEQPSTRDCPTINLLNHDQPLTLHNGFQRTIPWSGPQQKASVMHAGRCRRLG